MSGIRSKHTKPELILRKQLRGTGFYYHLKIVGNPDFAHKKKKIAIFVDGCFWHKCKKCYKQPKSNMDYWIPKIKRNVQRAKEAEKELIKKGWKVIRFWEHEVMSKNWKFPKKLIIYK